MRGDDATVRNVCVRERYHLDTGLTAAFSKHLGVLVGNYAAGWLVGTCTALVDETVRATGRFRRPITRSDIISSLAV